MASSMSIGLSRLGSSAIVDPMSVRLVTLQPAGNARHSHTVFRTAMGWVGLASRDATIVRLILPELSRRSAEVTLCQGMSSRRDFDEQMEALQRAIVDYFDGAPTPFDCVADISWAGPFGQKVLHQCCQVGLGQRTTYGQLARQAGSPRAARAVGAVMAANRLPLLIPCHRVLRTDGSLGGFSASGGLRLKERLLRHEMNMIVTPPACEK